MCDWGGEKETEEKEDVNGEEGSVIKGEKEDKEKEEKEKEEKEEKEKEEKERRGKEEEEEKVGVFVGGRVYIRPGVPFHHFFQRYRPSEVNEPSLYWIQVAHSSSSSSSSLSSSSSSPSPSASSLSSSSSRFSRGEQIKRGPSPSLLKKKAKAYLGIDQSELEEGNTRTIVHRLAIQTNVLTGKWMLKMDWEEGKVDEKWNKIGKGVIEGLFGAGAQAKCSTKLVSSLLSLPPLSSPSTLARIVLYLPDFRDFSRILHAREVLRTLGVDQNLSGKMYFKPDCYTLLQFKGLTYLYLDGEEIKNIEEEEEKEEKEKEKEEETD